MQIDLLREAVVEPREGAVGQMRDARPVRPDSPN